MLTSDSDLLTANGELMYKSGISFFSLTEVNLKSGNLCYLAIYKMFMKCVVGCTWKQYKFTAHGARGPT